MWYTCAITLSTVITKPKLPDLYQHITPQYALKWKVIGILLGLPIEKLNKIEDDRMFKAEPCCTAMLIQWLKDDATASWGKLFNAIQSLATISSVFDEDMSGALRSSTVDNAGLRQFKHPDKIDNRPLLEDLKHYITPQYAADWNVIGILLGLPSQRLEMIELNCFGRATRCCNAMLKYWLEADPIASWRKFFDTISLSAVSSTPDRVSDKNMSGSLRFLDMDDGRLEQFKHPDKVNTRPLMKDLYQHITPRYAVKWRVIGTLLGAPSERLDIIEHDNRSKAVPCCNDMLSSWLQRDATASWGKLLTVIESPAAISGEISDKEMFKKLYYQAKHNLGTEELQLYKLVIFGPPGVGKSSLFEVLLGGNPDPLRNSTGVVCRKLVQVKVAITTLDGQSKSSWHLIKPKDEILRLRSAIKRVIEKPKQLEVNLLPAVDVATDLDKSKMKVEEKLFQSSAKVPAQIQYASTLMACYDSGGQPEFFDVMPALTTIPTGNIMVFDLSIDLHSQIKSEFYEAGISSPLQHQAHYTTAELIKTAIANIQSYSKSVNFDTSVVLPELNTDTGRLLVVGTHLDKCGQTMYEKLRKVTETEETMCSDVLAGGTGQMVYYDCDGRVIHPISNTDCEGRDEAAQKIRTAIEDMSKYQKSYSQVPINWLLFQLEVQLTGEDYIERSKCIEIAERCYIKENEVNYVLMYFHELGILLHYKEVSGLKDIIFCNPQWLFDQLTELIKVKYNPPPLIQKDIGKGIFDKQRLFDIYSKRLDTKGMLKFENLLELFTHLKIMSELPNKPDQYQYFMPALLNPAPTGIPLQDEYGIKIHDAMLIKFENKYFPRGMFCCLVTDLVQCGWKIQVKHVYKNLIMFQIIPDHYVALFDEITHMAVEIRCKKGITSQHNHYDVCDKLYRSLKKLCETFQMECDFEFGFVCRDCKKFAGVKRQYPFSSNYDCKECQKSFELSHNQLVWLMPPHILEPQVSALQRLVLATNTDSVGPSQKTEANDSLDSTMELAGELHCNKKPDMWNLIKIVIPRVQAYWEDLAYAMQYDVNSVKTIRENCHDCEKCCRRLFEDWITTSHGIAPKTWLTLLERMKEVDSLISVSEDIEKELSSVFKKSPAKCYIS